MLNCQGTDVGPWRLGGKRAQTGSRPDQESVAVLVVEDAFNRGQIDLAVLKHSKNRGVGRPVKLVRMDNDRCRGLTGRQTREHLGRPLRPPTVRAPDYGPGILRLSSVF